jgi:hypothetical protein
MEKLIRVFLFFTFFLIATSAINAQQYFIIENFKSQRNFKYQVSDNIAIITKAGDFKIAGTLTQITDSSIFIDNYTEIKIHNIQSVVRTRKFIRKMSGLYFIGGGIAYLSIVGLNNAINHDTPIIDEQTAIISASMIATGFALKPLIHRIYKVEKGWRIKILDFNRINEPGKYPF